MSEELDSVSSRESAHVKARDRKIRGPKVVSVNPGLRKLAAHLAEKSKKSSASRSRKSSAKTGKTRPKSG